jgi:hypothetical protein
VGGRESDAERGGVAVENTEGRDGREAQGSITQNRDLGFSFKVDFKISRRASAWFYQNL